MTDEWTWSVGGIIRENRSAGRNACPSDTLSTTNATFTGLGYEKPATGRAYHGTSLQVSVTVQNEAVHCKLLWDYLLRLQQNGRTAVYSAMTATSCIHARGSAPAAGALTMHGLQ
jgi:hypothetical protein